MQRARVCVCVCACVEVHTNGSVSAISSYLFHLLPQIGLFGLTHAVLKMDHFSTVTCIQHLLTDLFLWLGNPDHQCFRAPASRAARNMLSMPPADLGIRCSKVYTKVRVAGSRAPGIVIAPSPGILPLGGQNLFMVLSTVSEKSCWEN